MHKNKSIIFKAALSLGLLTMLTSGVYADSSNLNNIVGKDRFETSILSSRMVKSDTAVLANGYSYADSLSAINLASSKKAKLILVKKGLNIASELKNQGVKTAYIVGGEKTIGKNIFNQVSEVVQNIKRISGQNRYETNDKTLKESGFKEVGVADGRNFPDALSASGLLINHHIGLLLVDGSKPYKTNYKVDYTFGGKNSVFQDGGKRLEGKNRYDTSIKIASEMGVPSSVVVTTGTDFADALSSINLININVNINTPVILVSNQLNDAQKQIISKATQRYILGGKVGISIETTIKNIDQKSEINNKDNTSNSNINTSTSIGKYVPSGSRRHSSSVDNSTAKKNSEKKDVVSAENPEVNEIIDQYVKLHDTLKKKPYKDMLDDNGKLQLIMGYGNNDYNAIYPVDFDKNLVDPSIEKFVDFRDAIKSEKIHSIRPITSDMSPKEQADQFIYNNFYAVNTMLRCITKNDKQRIDKAVNEYNSLPDSVKEILKTYRPYVSNRYIDDSFEDKSSVGNTFLNGDTLDYIKNDNVSLHNKVVFYELVNIGNVSDEDNPYGKFEDSMFGYFKPDSNAVSVDVSEIISYKKEYCDKLNNINEDYTKQVEKFNKSYSNLYNLTPDTVTYNNANEILTAIVDYRHLESEAQEKLKDNYTKIEKLSDKLSNMYDGRYEQDPQKYIEQENYRIHEQIAKTLNSDNDYRNTNKFNGAFPFIDDKGYGIYDSDNSIKLNDATLNLDTKNNKISVILNAKNYGDKNITLNKDYFLIQDILGQGAEVSPTNIDGGPFSKKIIYSYIGGKDRNDAFLDLLLKNSTPTTINVGETKKVTYEATIPKEITPKLVQYFKFSRGVDYMVSGNANLPNDEGFRPGCLYSNGNKIFYVNIDGNQISNDVIPNERISIDGTNLLKTDAPNFKEATAFIVEQLDKKYGDISKIEDYENCYNYSISRDDIIKAGYFNIGKKLQNKEELSGGVVGTSEVSPK